MRTLKLLELLYITVYVIISSQLLYYLFVMSDALRLVSVETFLNMRKAIDPIFKQRLSYVYYLAMILSLSLLILKRGEAFSLAYLLLFISFLSLFADLFIAVKGNMPVNDQISTYVAGGTEHDWNSLRKKWLTFITCRGIANATGLLSLLVRLVFRMDRS